MPLDTVYLSRDDLIGLHDAVVRRYGGLLDVRDEGALSSCVAQPATQVFGVERFGDHAEKAAAYCYFVVRLHPFLDGNKRAGFLAALHFLRLNGVSVLFDEEETFQLIMGVASGAKTVEDLASLIRAAIERATQ